MQPMEDLTVLEAHQNAVDSLAAEESAFWRLRSQLLRQHAGQFVAIYGGKVVGFAGDDEELARQMFQRLGDAPFLIARVEEAPTVYELPSPEVIR